MNGKKAALIGNDLMNKLEEIYKEMQHKKLPETNDAVTEGLENLIFELYSYDSAVAGWVEAAYQSEVSASEYNSIRQVKLDIEDLKTKLFGLDIDEKDNQLREYSGEYLCFLDSALGQVLN
mgnify:CR=1 FL=1|tara:strand:+ start:4343 stop:4705 length:363 start_codon:yes stop_codon:yes gene_type:complete